MKVEPYTIESIIHQLEFRSSDRSFLEYVNLEYSNTIQREYLEFVELIQVEAPNGDEKIIMYLSLLSENELIRFLNYPQVSAVFRNRNVEIEKKISYLTLLLCGELAKIEKLPDGYFCDNSFTPTYSHFIKYNTSKSGFELIELFLLYDCLVVDFMSNVSTNEKDLKNLEFSEMDSVYQMIYDSLSPIEGTIPFEFILKLQQVIRVKGIMRKHDYMTISSSKFIGQIDLFSSHFDKVTTEEIIEALIHESIHVLLDKWNYFNPWEPQFEGCDVKTIVSPWTGNKINLAGAFTSAVFVWYGLYNFFTTCLEKKIYDEGRVSKKIDFIKSGFKKLNVDQSFSNLSFDGIDHLKYQFLSMQKSVE